MPELDPVLQQQFEQQGALERVRHFVSRKLTHYMVAGMSVMGMVAQEQPSTAYANAGDDIEDTRVPAGGVVKVHATDIPGQTIMGNLTETNATGPGFVTAYPCAEGLPDPLTSNLNFPKGVDVANSVVVKADQNGDVCFRPNVSTDLVWDQTVATSAFEAGKAVRLLDTRETAPASDAPHSYTFSYPNRSFNTTSLYTVRFKDPLTCYPYIDTAPGYYVIPEIEVDMTPGSDAMDPLLSKVSVGIFDYHNMKGIQHDELVLNYGFYDTDPTGKLAVSAIVGKTATFGVHIKILGHYDNAVLSDQILTYSTTCAP